MAQGGDRFRHLRAPRTGDLFEHFGVATAPEPVAAPASPSAAAVVAAAPCDACGWYRSLPVRGACPVCGAPGREGGTAG